MLNVKINLERLTCLYLLIKNIKYSFYSWQYYILHLKVAKRVYLKCSYTKLHVLPYVVKIQLSVGDRQGGLACCNSWGRKESDTTEQLNWTQQLSFSSNEKGRGRQSRAVTVVSWSRQWCRVFWSLDVALALVVTWGSSTSKPHIHVYVPFYHEQYLHWRPV